MRDLPLERLVTDAEDGQRGRVAQQLLERGARAHVEGQEITVRGREDQHRRRAVHDVGDRPQPLLIEQQDFEGSTGREGPGESQCRRRTPQRVGDVVHAQRRGEMADDLNPARDVGDQRQPQPPAVRGQGGPVANLGPGEQPDLALGRGIADHAQPLRGELGIRSQRGDGVRRRLSGGPPHHGRRLVRVLVHGLAARQQQDGVRAFERRALVGDRPFSGRELELALALAQQLEEREAPAGVPERRVPDLAVADQELGGAPAREQLEASGQRALLQHRDEVDEAEPAEVAGEAVTAHHGLSLALALPRQPPADPQEQLNVGAGAGDGVVGTGTQEVEVIPAPGTAGRDHDRNPALAVQAQERVQLPETFVVLRRSEHDQMDPGGGVDPHRRLKRLRQIDAIALGAGEHGDERGAGRRILGQNEHRRRATCGAVRARILDDILVGHGRWARAREESVSVRGASAGPCARMRVPTTSSAGNRLWSRGRCTGSNGLAHRPGRDGRLSIGGQREGPVRGGRSEHPKRLYTASES